MIRRWERRKARAPPSHFLRERCRLRHAQAQGDLIVPSVSCVLKIPTGLGKVNISCVCVWDCCILSYCVVLWMEVVR